MKTGSTYQYAALEERVQRLSVIMKPARPGGIEVAGLSGLAWREESDLIDFRTIHMFGMWVREHFVHGRVVVHECDLATDADRQGFWTDTGGGDGECGPVAWCRRRGSPIV